MQHVEAFTLAEEVYGVAVGQITAAATATHFAFGNRCRRGVRRYRGGSGCRVCRDEGCYLLTPSHCGRKGTPWRVGVRRLGGAAQAKTKETDELFLELEARL